MLAPTKKQTGQQSHGAEDGNRRDGIALHGTSTLHGLAAGDAGNPGTLPRGIMAPVGQGIAEIACDIASVVRKGLADISGLATQFADLISQSIQRIVLAAAGGEQIFKMHGILPGYGRNAIGRTQVPHTINDFGLKMNGQNPGSRMVSI